MTLRYALLTTAVAATALLACVSGAAAQDVYAGKRVQQVVEKPFASPRDVIERPAEVTRPGRPS